MIDFIIMGAGGAGRTVLGTCADISSRVGFLDDNCAATVVNGAPVLGTTNERGRLRGCKYIIAFGSRFQRERSSVFATMQAEGYTFFNAINSQAYVDRFAVVGQGVFVGAQSAILPNANVGNNCYICVGCSVDHDCVVECGTYLAPGVHLAGGVHVGESVFIGIGAVVLPLVRVGAGAVIGAGAVVMHDVVPGAVVAGVPARTLHKKES